MINGYPSTEKLYEGRQTIVYRGVRESDKQPVIVKILKGEYPSPESLARLKREYEIIRDINSDRSIDGVVKVYGLEKSQSTLAMIFEDFGGESLSRLFTAGHPLELPLNRPLDLKDFLNLFIRITEIVGQIHQCGIIHKDINPTNIVFNPQTNIIKLIDFGIASQLSREITTAGNPGVLEGTLPYMSPEQTGRMNRVLDFRTDFYSNLKNLALRARSEYSGFAIYTAQCYSEVKLSPQQYQGVTH
ncbi:MAG: protein kinase, partial [Desulfosalsimonadaceae bacterium]